MPEGEAFQEAMTAVAHAVAAPDSGLYGHKVKLVRLYRGKNELGSAAWVGMFRDRTGGGEVCVRVWVQRSPIVQTYHRDLDSCDLEPGTLPDEDDEEPA